MVSQCWSRGTRFHPKFDGYRTESGIASLFTQLSRPKRVCSPK